MTIDINATTAAALAAAGTENNPLILWDNLGASGTWSTGVGTEVNDAAYAGTGTTYDQWEATPNGSGQASLVVDLGSNTSVSMVAMAAHNIADVGQVRAASSTDNVTYTNRGANQTPTDNQAIAWYFPSVSARYWRLWFTSLTGNPIVGVMAVGNPLTVEQPIYQGYRPPITPTEVALQSNVSEGGHLLGSSAVKKASTANAAITLIDPATFRASAWTGFQTHFNEGGGFFWAWRPTKYGDLHYAWRSGAPFAPENAGPKDYMSGDLNMRFYDEP